MLVTYVECPKCKELIYSRSIHDMHYCSCGSIFVDGGPNSAYIRVGTSKPDISPSEILVSKKEIPESEQELYDDWNYNINKLGTIVDYKDDYWS